MLIINTTCLRKTPDQITLEQCCLKMPSDFSVGKIILQCDTPPSNVTGRNNRKINSHLLNKKNGVKFSEAYFKVISLLFFRYLHPLTLRLSPLGLWLWVGFPGKSRQYIRTARRRQRRQFFARVSSCRHRGCDATSSC